MLGKYECEIFALSVLYKSRKLLVSVILPLNFMEILILRQTCSYRPDLIKQTECISSIDGLGTCVKSFFCVSLGVTSCNFLTVVLCRNPPDFFVFLIQVLHKQTSVCEIQIALRYSSQYIKWAVALQTCVKMVLSVCVS